MGRSHLFWLYPYIFDKASVRLQISKKSLFYQQILDETVSDKLPNEPVSELAYEGAACSEMLIDQTLPDATSVDNVHVTPSITAIDHNYVRDTEQRPTTRDFGTQWENPTFMEHSYGKLSSVETSQYPISKDQPIQAEPIAASTPKKANLRLNNSISSVHLNDSTDDPLYQPSDEESLDELSYSSEANDEATYNSQTHCQSKYLVYNENLLQLFNRCQKCGEMLLSKTCVTKGTLLSVTYECSGGCSGVWHSQPLHQKMPLGNLQIAGAILFSGGQFTKFKDFFQILGVPFFSESTFYSLQDAYLFPVIDERFCREQDALLALFSNERVWLLGDGQCDSPGHSAKYLAYTAIEEESGVILTSKLVSVAEVDNSNAMELEGLHRCLEEVTAHHVVVEGVATDRHPQIRAYMKKTRPNIEHQFEVFHTAKGVTKELSRASNSRETDALAPWIQSISNHLWCCSATCNGDPQVR